MSDRHGEAVSHGRWVDYLVGLYVLLLLVAVSASVVAIVFF